MYCAVLIFFNHNQLTIKKRITHHLQNLPGWHTKRKIVVFESDDWGSIRMPSRETYGYLMREGYRPDRDPYLKYDGLAGEADLLSLFETLSKFKDKNNKPACLTANVVVANPDFKKIGKNDFEAYYFEPFTDTLKHQPGCSKAFALWKQGMEKGIFYPQFHGREHLNVDRWLLGLKEKNPLLHKAFDLDMISLGAGSSALSYDYMEALDFFSCQEKTRKADSIEQGLDLFKDIFKTGSRSFIANCYIWHRNLHRSLKNRGVQYIQGIPFQYEPVLSDGKHHHKRIFHYTGQTNDCNQIYIVRNAHFEPSQTPNKNSVDECLKRVDIAFKMRKPAVIGSHRLNYIGRIDPSNREKNLKLFRELLEKMTRRWPDIEFMTTEQLGDLIWDSQMHSVN